MPYIKDEARDDLGVYINITPRNAGELNYCITMLIKQYWEHQEKQYQRINDIMGALESAKAEFYRRIVVPYEGQKIAENGDVY